MSPTKCVARFSFMVFHCVVQEAFLLRVVHFITLEERVSRVFLFVSACQFCLFRDIDLLLLCGFVVAVG